MPLNGVFDEATGRALIAYRKMTGLSRVAVTRTGRCSSCCRRAPGTFHVRYPDDGRHVEGDLTSQVLAEIEPGGHVRALYTMSSGKPSTPTVIGRFRVYNKTPGTNSEGMVDSNYFIRGYAIHGYAEVPDVRGQPRLPARADPRRAGDLRLGAVRHARRRLQRERRRQHTGTWQRRSLDAAARSGADAIMRAMKPSPKP